jgi:hypothetical protein
MTRKVIEKGWRDYCEKVLPRDASTLQIEETRRGFYAGALTVFHGIVSSLSGSSDEPTEQDVQIIDDVATELAAYSDEVSKLAGAGRPSS